MSGVTTLLGGGTGPATGTNATTCTAGPWNIQRMLQAAEGLPINLGLPGKGNASLPAALDEQIEAGAMGLKLHEDRAQLLPLSTTVFQWRSLTMYRLRSTPIRSMNPVLLRIHLPPLAIAAYTPTIPKAPAAVMHPTLLRRLVTKMPCRLQPTRRALIQSIQSMSIWICSWSVIICRRRLPKT